LKGLEGLSAPDVGFLLRQIGKSFARSLFFSGLTFALAAGVFWTRRFTGMWKILAIGVVFADLFIAGSGWNPVIPVRWAKFSLPPAIQFLKQDKEIYRIAGVDPAIMPPNLATLCGLQDIRGYDVPVERRYHLFFQKALRGRTAWWIYEFPKLEMEAMPFLSLVNVKYVLSLGPLPPPLALVYDKEIKIYKNPESFSRAFLVHQAETVKNGAEALDRVLALGPELKHVAVLDGPLPEPVSKLTTAGAEEGTGDRVQVISYTARQIEIEVETLSPGILILGDTYYPGWKAEIDGKGAPIFRANYLLRGIAVGPGSHRVRFFYRPFSFYIGRGLTMAAGVMIVWCLKRKKRRTEEK